MLQDSSRLELLKEVIGVAHPRGPYVGEVLEDNSPRRCRQLRVARWFDTEFPRERESGNHVAMPKRLRLSVSPVPS